jgi:hypothetical protein
VKKPADVSPPSTPDRGRFSTRKKTKAVIRLLRGEDLDKVSRELKVTAATLAGWRHLSGRRPGQSQEPSDAGSGRGSVRRLKAKVGELTMDNELLQIRAERAEEMVGRSPLAARRSRP